LQYPAKENAYFSVHEQGLAEQAFEVQKKSLVSSRRSR